MTRKVWILIAVAVVLGGISFYLNKDRFAKDNIQIYHRSRPSRLAFLRRRRAGAPPSNVNPIIFGFDRRLKLNDLEVIPVSAIETNKYPKPIWHLVSESNSIPIKDFGYGVAIQGMHPAIKGAVPDPLEPGVPYRLIVAAGKTKLAHDFTPDPSNN